MCLDKVTKKYDTDNDEMVVAYKVFKKIRNNFFSLFRYKNIKYIEGKECKSTDSVITATIDDINYRSGFHAFTTLKSAKKYAFGNYKICEIHLWDLCAKGKQEDLESVVAKNMRIIREVQ